MASMVARRACVFLVGSTGFLGALYFNERRNTKYQHQVNNVLQTKIREVKDQNTILKTKEQELRNCKDRLLKQLNVKTRQQKQSALKIERIKGAIASVSVDPQETIKHVALITYMVDADNPEQVNKITVPNLSEALINSDLNGRLSVIKFSSPNDEYVCAGDVWSGIFDDETIKQIHERNYIWCQLPNDAEVIIAGTKECNKCDELSKMYWDRGFAWVAITSNIFVES